LLPGNTSGIHVPGAEGIRVPVPLAFEIIRIFSSQLPCRPIGGVGRYHSGYGTARKFAQSHQTIARIIKAFRDITQAIICNDPADREVIRGRGKFGNDMERYRNISAGLRAAAAEKLQVGLIVLINV